MKRPEINEAGVGFSRDGCHWSRPDRRAFCPVSEAPRAWSYGNAPSAGVGCLVGGDKPVRLRFSLAGGSRYAFWLSQDERGASGGCVGAGGPGFSGEKKD